jgi:hypothetical protein
MGKILDRTDAHILQSRNASLQFDNTEVGILSNYLFQDSPGLPTDLSLLPRPKLLGDDGVGRVSLGKD